MAALPSPTQVAGTHCAIYEAYYHQVDPNGTGAVQALDAARFLKKSRLSDVVLSKIWDLSDPTGKGYLDKAGLFVALKLVALAQAGKDINMSNIHSEAPPPKVGELPKVPPQLPPGRPAAPSPSPAPLGDWTMKPAEREKYSQLFDSLQPNNGLIAGNKVKGVLMESKLPLDTLGKIWDLADQDKDGMLDRHEFMVAMHLVYKALEKHAVPTMLPAELRRAPPARPPSRPPSRPASRPPSPGARPPPPRPQPPPSGNSLIDGLLDLSSPVSSAPSAASAPLPPWPLPPDVSAQYAAQFAAADADRDGYVSGAEIKHTFLNTGLSHQTLAHIWALCDRSGLGKLSQQQFALAMWLVQRALRGLQPPPQLPQDILDTLAQPVEAVETLGPQPTPEMEAIAREIDALARERRTLEAEIQAKERELTATNVEADGLQSELDTLTATQKQLENQKGEAQKRLNDLKSQVEKLRSQVSAQESAAAETEAEVMARRAALASLRDKEAALQAQAQEAQHEADDITAQLSKTVLAVSQANIKIAHLEEQYRLISSAAEAVAAGAAPAQLTPQYSRQHLDRLVRGATPHEEEEDFSKSNGFANGSSGFESDPFKDSGFPQTTPASTNDPFAPAHTHNQSGFGSDPFAGNADPFAGDSFAPTDNKTTNDSAWENDPFAVLHAPTRASGASGASGGGAGAEGGGGGGTPALPPKHHKTPPPRPAPPRPNPPHKTMRAAMDFTDDPFKDYRYEDPFNIEDPFADAVDAAPRPASVAAFGADAFAPAAPAPAPALNGRQSAPPARDAAWAAWPDDGPGPAAPRAAWPADAWGDNTDSWTGSADNWAAPADDWAGKTDNWASKTDNWAAKTDGRSNKSDNWASKSDNWTSKSDNWTSKPDNWANKADDWTAEFPTDRNKNLNETWPSSTLPAKKEKSPKPVKYAKSLVHTIGGIGRSRHKKANNAAAGGGGGGGAARGVDALPSEEQQWAWAAAESRRLQLEADHRRRQEDAELQLALAISRQEK